MTNDASDRVVDARDTSLPPLIEVLVENALMHVVVGCAAVGASASPLAHDIPHVVHSLLSAD